MCFFQVISNNFILHYLLQAKLIFTLFPDYWIGVLERLMGDEGGLINGEEEAIKELANA
jgi:hypothetical protein